MSAGILAHAHAWLSLAALHKIAPTKPTKSLIIDLTLVKRVSDVNIQF